MFDFDQIADGTVQVRTATSLGSGFLAVTTETVVTNHHVAGNVGDDVAVLYDGTVIPGRVIASDAPTDWSIIELARAAGGSCLSIAEASVHRGDPVVFAGFPHGIGDLLTHRAWVSGPFEEGGHRIGFHLDASINGGNSGGPVVNEANEIVGIVTARRYVGGADLTAAGLEAQNLVADANRMRSGGVSMRLGPVDFASMLEIVGGALSITARVAAANANSGIGIAYDIDHVRGALARL